MKVHSSTRYFGRSLLSTALTCLGLALLLTIITVEPLLKLKAMSFDDGTDFEGFDGTLCGHVAAVRPDPSKRGTVLSFDNSYTPSFEILISSRDASLQSTYSDKTVCVAGRFTRVGSQDMPRINLSVSQLYTQVVIK